MTVDLERGEALDPLPEGVELAVNRTAGAVIELAFLAPEPPESGEYNLVFYQVGSGSYRTPGGTEHAFGSRSSMRVEELWPGTDGALAVPRGVLRGALPAGGV